MWQCEYQSPFHETGMKLQIIIELKYLEKAVTNTNGKKDYYFSFLKSRSHICKAYQSTALLQYMDILAECGGGGRFIDW